MENAMRDDADLLAAFGEWASTVDKTLYNAEGEPFTASEMWHVVAAIARIL